MTSPSSSWLFYASSSGACAAINGVFAKLTTTHLTSSWASAVSRVLGREDSSYAVEIAVRVSFFLTNLAFNGVMWGLFTRALTLADSTVRVSVINTSSNFVLTAVLGFAVFGEELPALWWVGAALLVTGSVIIGRRDEEHKIDGHQGSIKPTSEKTTQQVGSTTDRGLRKRMAR